ncbi:MAG: DUF3089 domain-containing protein [Flavobacteriales bacterium]|nr:DUF3089 domain-containing protein [Flavobacteriales bacterium]
MRKFTIFLTLTLFGCNIHTTISILVKENTHPSVDFQEKKNDFQLDYSELNNWAFRDDYNNYQDLLPKGIVKEEDIGINIFFIHPTTLYTSDNWNSDTSSFKDDQVIQLSLENQASCFAGIGNIYAPHYRQMHIHSYIDTINGYKAFNLAYNDVLQAFKYFIKEINNNQDFIIAAHSQGTNHAMRLITEYISKDKLLSNKLILSYLIGMNVKKDFSSILPCSEPTDLYCFLSWRTFSEFNYPNNWVYGDHIASVNPITWRNDTISSDKKLHSGILLPNRILSFKETLSIYNHKGLIWLKKPNNIILNLYPSRNYHPGDYNLYWMNIRENLKLRLQDHQDNNVNMIEKKSG